MIDVSFRHVGPHLHTEIDCPECHRTPGVEGVVTELQCRCGASFKIGAVEDGEDR